MKRPHGPTRLWRAFLWAAPGAALLATSCGLSVRESLISAGSDFVGQSFTTLLDALFPLEDWFAPPDQE